MSIQTGPTPSPLAQPAALLLTVTISAGQSLSAAVSCSTGGTLARVYTPLAWDAALLSFQISPDNVTFYDIFTADDQELTFNITPKAMVFTKPYILSANNWIKLRSGQRNNPRVQTADRVFQLALI